MLKTNLLGVWILDGTEHSDERGCLVETYSEKYFSERGLNTKWARRLTTTNIKRGTIRGLHYSYEPEVKLIHCSRGMVFDVLLDTRKDSPSYGKWQAFRLGEHLNQALYVPPGVAHGYQTIRKLARVDYLISTEYMPEAAAGFAWNSPKLDIPWPNKISFTVSGRDKDLPRFQS